MAPSRKQAATPASKSSRKRPKKAQDIAPVDPRVKELSRALQQSQQFPEEVSSMLKAIMPYSLGVAHAERSPCQHEVVDMLSDAFLQVEAEFTSRITEAEAKTQSVGSSQAEVLQKTTNFEAAIQQRVEAVTAKKAAFEQAKAIVKTNEERLAKAAAALKDSSGQLDKIAVRLERVKVVHKEKYVPLQEGSIDLAAVGTVVAMGKQLGFDDSLLLSAQAVLGKPVEARTQFDLMVFQNFQDEVTKQMAALEEDVTKCEADKSRNAEAFESVNVECDAEKSKFGAIEMELAAAVAEEAKHRDDLANAASAVKELEASSLEAADALERERARLSAFHEEVIDKFRELKEPPPPPPPPPEAASVLEVEASVPGVETEATGVAAQPQVSKGPDDMPVDAPAAGTSSV